MESENLSQLRLRTIEWIGAASSRSMRVHRASPSLRQENATILIVFENKQATPFANQGNAFGFVLDIDFLCVEEFSPAVDCYLSRNVRCQKSSYIRPCDRNAMRLATMGAPIANEISAVGHDSELTFLHTAETVQRSDREYEVEPVQHGELPQRVSSNHG